MLFTDMFSPMFQQSSERHLSALARTGARVNDFTTCTQAFSFTSSETLRGGVAKVGTLL